MIEPGKKVKIHYTLVVEGKVVDSSRASEPFEYEPGRGQILNGLEKAREGLAPGEKREITVGPDDGYGPLDPQAIVEIPKTNFPANGDLEVGSLVQGEGKGGQVFQGVVREVHEEDVTVDFNHPLAGKELFFDVEVLEVA